MTKTSMQEDFPVVVLPDILKRYVNAAAKCLDCDPCMVITPLLPALAACVGNSTRIELRRSWQEPLIIWGIVIADSGTMKSPAIEKATRALNQLQDETYLEYKAKLKVWKDRNQQGQPPVWNRIIAADITIEKLAGLLQENPRGLLLLRDELAGWLNSFDAYRRGKGGDVARWLELQQGKPLTIDRKGSPTVHIPMASVSVTGGIQPGALRRSLGQEHFDNGLAARLLMAMPMRKIKVWTDAEMPASLEDEMLELCRRLRMLDFAPGDEDNLKPTVIPLTNKGRIAFKRWCTDHYEKMAELSGELAAVWSKLEAYCARIALLFHLVNCQSADPPMGHDMNAVGPADLAAAAQVVRWYGNEAIRIYGILREDESDTRRRELVELIRAKGGSITVRELQRTRKADCTNAADARAFLLELQRQGFGKLMRVPAGEKGGAPSERFGLNPDYLSPATISEQLCREQAAAWGSVNCHIPENVEG